MMPSGFCGPTVAMAFPVGDEINLAKFYGLVSGLDGCCSAALTR
jgi:hypothetical protein